jgi:hypothetical protein
MWAAHFRQMVILRARSRNFGSSLLSIYTSCHMFSAAAAVPKDIDLAKPDLLS